MKKFFKWLFIFIVGITLIGFVFSLFESDESKAVSDINGKTEQLKNANSMSEIATVYNVIDSLYASNNSEEVQNALKEAIGKRASLEKSIKQKIEFGIKSAAYDASKEYIIKQLKSPSTAKFVDFSETAMAQDEDMFYHIYMKVDSQNGFGAKIRTNFDIKFLPIQGEIKFVEVNTY